MLDLSPLLVESAIAEDGDDRGAQNGHRKTGNLGEEVAAWVTANMQAGGLSMVPCLKWDQLGLLPTADTWLSLAAGWTAWRGHASHSESSSLNNPFAHTTYPVN